MIGRRSFLGAILAAGVAPAAVGSGILMPVRKIVEPLHVGLDFGFQVDKFAIYEAFMRDGEAFVQTRFVVDRHTGIHVLQQDIIKDWRQAPWAPVPPLNGTPA